MFTIRTSSRHLPNLYPGHYNHVHGSYSVDIEHALYEFKTRSDMGATSDAGLCSSSSMHEVVFYQIYQRLT